MQADQQSGTHVHAEFETTKSEYHTHVHTCTCRTKYMYMYMSSPKKQLTSFDSFKLTRSESGEGRKTSAGHMYVHVHVSKTY